MGEFKILCEGSQYDQLYSNFDRKVGKIKMESNFVIFLLFVFMADMTSVVNSQSKTTVSLSSCDI